MAEISDEEAGPNAGSVGARLKAGRAAAGLDLADIAARTRIPLRHLAAIEEDRFDSLPSPTYGIGFARAYARSVGLDEVSVAAQVRQQISDEGHARAEYVAFEPADPARVPSRLLAWTAAIIGLLIVAGYAVWRTNLLNGPAPTVTTRVEEPQDQPSTPVAPAPAAARPATPTSGPVVLTANDTVWMRISDATGKRLFEKEMQAGERYEVPADANAPVIRTGRPQALTVTVGGAPVAPLGSPDATIDKVGISAAALAARPPAPVATPTPTPAAAAATPAAGASPTP
jgi:cytoskeletal protein RodZ